MKTRTGRRWVLGVDIGGTKLAVGVVSDKGEQKSRRRIPTDTFRGPEDVTRRLIALCKQSVLDAGLSLGDLAGVGVGCGGPLDPKKGLILSPPSLPGWDRFPLVALLKQGLKRPVWLDNDANAAALGEHVFGAGKGFKHLVYLTLSTGIGGGVILDGKLYRGATGNAAELGHLSVSYDGWPCICGSRGCLEAFASGTHIARRAREAAKGHVRSALWKLAGSRGLITAEHVVAAVRAKDKIALRVWDDTTLVLGAGIAGMINAFNPERVILGGGVTAAGPLLFKPLRRIALARAMKPLARGVDIVPAKLGGDVGILGAAAVALAKLERE